PGRAVEGNPVPVPLTTCAAETTNEKIGPTGQHLREKPFMQSQTESPVRTIAKPGFNDTNPLATGPLAIVGGCGHVGLPLGLAFARKGYQVDLLDTNPERVALVNSGTMPFHEDDA